MKVGLVLEGGGMRGLFTAGVLDHLMDFGLKVDGIVAVSSGALFGVNFLSGQRGRALRYNKQYSYHPYYMSFRSWVKTGNYVNKDFTYYTLPRELDVFDQAAFANSGVPFYATITNLLTGQAEYPLITDVFKEMELLRATSALPLISRIVEWQGIPYLDGGIADSIPLEFAQSLGFDKLIVICTRPKTYRKKPANKFIYQAVYRNYPKFVQACVNRHQVYNDTVEKIIDLEQRGDIFVIRPQMDLKIGRLEKDPLKFEEIYQIGLQEARSSQSNLSDYLAK